MATNNVAFQVDGVKTTQSGHNEPLLWDRRELETVRIMDSGTSGTVVITASSSS
jgi:hypothetical protein